MTRKCPLVVHVYADYTDICLFISTNVVELRGNRWRRGDENTLKVESAERPRDTEG